MSLPAVVDNLTGLFAPFEAAPNEKGEMDARLLWCNQGLLNVLSTSLEDLSGRFFSEFAPNDLAWLPYIVDVGQGRLDYYSAEPYSAEANIYIHTEIYSPRPGYAVILHVDRKQFIQSEAEQEQREKKVSSIFQYMPSGFCLFDLIYDEQGNPVDIISEFFILKSQAGSAATHFRESV